VPIARRHAPRKTFHRLQYGLRLDSDMGIPSGMSMCSEEPLRLYQILRSTDGGNQWFPDKDVPRAGLDRRGQRRKCVGMTATLATGSQKEATGRQSENVTLVRHPSPSPLAERVGGEGAMVGTA